MTFGTDFLRGLKKGWNGAKKVVDYVPGVNVISKQLPRLHKGGRVPSTQAYMLRGGEIVLNKTQQAALKKAKTAKTKNMIIANVGKRTPKPTAAMKRHQKK
jgi:hypothetical protein